MGGEISLRPYNPHGGIAGGVAQLVLLRDGRREVRPVRSFRAVAGGYLIRFIDFHDRESVSVLTHAEVRIERTALPALGPGEYYVEDVIGCAVEDEGGRALGVAQEIFWNGAHDVATVADGAGVERLIPLVPEVVLTADTPGRKIRVRWDVDG